MGKFDGKEEYHDIYPEFNDIRERMIVHKERKGASGLLALAALLSTLLAVVALTRVGVIRPELMKVTETSASVDVMTDFTDSDLSYPLPYALYPYDGVESPVSPFGTLLLSDAQVKALGPAVQTGALNQPEEHLHFLALDNATDYLLLFYSRDESGSETLQSEALLIQLPKPGSATVSPSGGKSGGFPGGTPSSEPGPDEPPTPTPTPVEATTPTPGEPGSDETPTPTPVVSTDPGSPTVKPYTPTETKHTVSIVHEPPSGGSGYLTIGDSTEEVTSLRAKKGEEIKLHLKPNSPYTESQVTLGTILIEGDLKETDDPYTFIMGSEDSVLHFSISYPTTGHIVTPVDAEHGETLVNGSSDPIYVEPGELVIVGGVPEDGYEQLHWELLSGSVQEPFSLAFIMGEEDVSVRSTFRRLYKVTVVNMTPEGGTISLSENPFDAMEGLTVYLDCSPNENYAFDYLSVNGTVYTEPNFPMGSEDVEVLVYFKPVIHGITLTVSGSGTVSAPKTAQTGDTVSVSATPAEGNLFVKMVIDGVEYSSASVSFVMPDHDVTGTVTFAKAYTVTVECEEGFADLYTISSLIGITGDKITFGAKPGSGYTVTYEIIGAAEDGPGYFIFGDSDVVLYLYFDKLFSVTVISSEGGTVTASPTVGEYGTTVTLTGSPGPNYFLVGFEVQFGSGDSLYLEADSSSQASFELIDDATVTPVFVS